MIMRVTILSLIADYPGRLSRRMVAQVLTGSPAKAVRNLATDPRYAAYREYSQGQLRTVIAGLIGAGELVQARNRLYCLPPPWHPPNPPKGHLSTHELARRMGMGDGELAARLVSAGLIIVCDREWILTDRGEVLGGWCRYWSEDEYYIVWPPDLDLADLVEGTASGGQSVPLSDDPEGERSA
jgi:hypothetical protein